MQNLHAGNWKNQAKSSSFLQIVNSSRFIRNCCKIPKSEMWLRMTAGRHWQQSRVKCSFIYLIIGFNRGKWWMISRDGLGTHVTRVSLPCAHEYCANIEPREGGRLDVLPYLLSWSLSLSPLPLSLSLLTLQHPLSPPIFHPLCFLLESDYRPRWSTTINDVSGEFVHVHSPLFPGVERRKRGGGGRRWKGSSVFRIRKAYSLHGAKL